MLHTVLSERSVARAAERLHVTPSALAPAIARGLRELELAIHELPFDPTNCTRTFTLAVADAGQITWVPRIAALMTAELPNARLSVAGIDSLVSLGHHSGLPWQGKGWPISLDVGTRFFR